VVRRTPNKAGKTARVTFELPPQVGARSASVCGEFNDWSPEMHPLKPRKDGGFSATVTLPVGRAYRYRYLVDGERWENDWSADEYAPNGFGGDDSVVHL